MRADDNAPMHYQHRYHAGNFADVFKHALLCALLENLSRKDKPWFYLETHAGAGRYDLLDEAAGRTAEFHDGIARLWPPASAPAPLAAYLQCVAALNPDGALRHYPGSPAVARALARPGDRLAYCEKIPEIAAQLKRHCSGPHAAVHVQDGYQSLGFLPPPEKRGLVLIDPAFERTDEFDAVADYLEQALLRFRNGIYAVWYPLKNRHGAERFCRRAARLGVPGLEAIFDTGAPGEGQMRACGLLVLNPPFGFEAQARAIVQTLVRPLTQGSKAAARVHDLSQASS